tara:strand:- start:533 stop:1126 length:594 start_codon:yes stop_codon:yes gene_type:complete
MNFVEIENKVVKTFMEILMDYKEDDCSLEKISKKSKIKLSDLQSLYPFEEKTNNLIFLKIFLKNLDNNIIFELQKETSKEKLTNFEIILEGIFLRFENLFPYKFAISKMSNNLNKKLINFNVLLLDNHFFMLKLLKLSGDKANFMKLNLKATLLNGLFVKNMNNFLNDKTENINLIMREVDDDLKKLFEINFIFNET